MCIVCVCFPQKRMHAELWRESENNFNLVCSPMPIVKHTNRKNTEVKTWMMTRPQKSERFVAFIKLIRVYYVGLHQKDSTVWLKWIATLCSRYASPPPLYCMDDLDSSLFSTYTTPPPLYEQFSSSFRFVQFSHWTVQI